MTEPLASESTYLMAWQIKDIAQGVAAGRLTTSLGKADLRSINMLPEDRTDLKEKQRK